jgi:acylphosphatase
MMDSKQRLTAKIYGRVQGVGFRVYIQEKARFLGLTGYARNRYVSQRYVEVVAEGRKSNLEIFLDHLKQGPSLARVEHVDVQWGTATNEFNKFGVS